jgi:hypothetical protein
MNYYFIGEYEIVSELSDRDLRKLVQVAFAVNHGSKKLVIDRSGHALMARKFNLDRSEYQGGWIFPRKGKITFYSGTLGHVDENMDAISNAISYFLGMALRGVAQVGRALLSGSRGSQVQILSPRLLVSLVKGLVQSRPKSRGKCH